MVALTRPVIDPNVFVSAVITPSGTTGIIVELVGAGLVVPVLSAELLAELDGVLRRPRFRRYLDLEECAAFVTELERLGVVVEQPTDTPTVSRDPDDDYLVALARAAGTDVLVSGDIDLTDLDLNDVATLTPRQYLDTLAAEAGSDR